MTFNGSEPQPYDQALILFNKGETSWNRTKFINIQSSIFHSFATNINVTHSIFDNITAGFIFYLSNNPDNSLSNFNNVTFTNINLVYSMISLNQYIIDFNFLTVTNITFSEDAVTD